MSIKKVKNNINDVIENNELTSPKGEQSADKKQKTPPNYQTFSTTANLVRTPIIRSNLLQTALPPRKKHCSRKTRDWSYSKKRHFKNFTWMKKGHSRNFFGLLTRKHNKSFKSGPLLLIRSFLIYYNPFPALLLLSTNFKNADRILFSILFMRAFPSIKPQFAGTMPIKICFPFTCNSHEYILESCQYDHKLYCLFAQKQQKSRLNANIERVSNKSALNARCASGANGANNVHFTIAALFSVRAERMQDGKKVHKIFLHNYL